MTLCPASCHLATPNSTADCDKKTKPGGILHLLAFSCAWGFDTTVTINGVPTAIGPITDVDNWIIGVQNGYIGISPEGIGDKPVSEKTTEAITACLPDGVTGEDHVVNFISKILDVDDFSQCTFWSNFKKNHRRYRLGWLDCDLYVYVKSQTGQPGFNFTLSGNADMVIPDNNREATRFEFSPTFRFDPNDGLICPLEVPDIAEILSVEVLS